MSYTITEYSDLIKTQDVENITELYLKNSEKQTVDLQRFKNLKKLFLCDNEECDISVPDSLESFCFSSYYNVLFRGTEDKIKVMFIKCDYKDVILNNFNSSSLEILSIYDGNINIKNPIIHLIQNSFKLKELYITSSSYNLTDIAFPDNIKVISMKEHYCFNDDRDTHHRNKFIMGNVKFPKELDILYLRSHYMYINYPCILNSKNIIIQGTNINDLSFMNDDDVKIHPESKNYEEYLDSYYDRRGYKRPNIKIFENIFKNYNINQISRTSSGFSGLDPNINIYKYYESNDKNNPLNRLNDTFYEKNNRKLVNHTAFEDLFAIEDERFDTDDFEGALETEEGYPYIGGF